jgi:hypothetical protein
MVGWHLDMKSCTIEAFYWFSLLVFIDRLTVIFKKFGGRLPEVAVRLLQPSFVQGILAPRKSCAGSTAAPDEAAGAAF